MTVKIKKRLTFRDFEYYQDNDMKNFLAKLSKEDFVKLESIPETRLRFKIFYMEEVEEND